MRVNIIGGGPSGLFLAILLKSRGTADEVNVYEQNPRSATYGFGVAMIHAAIEKLQDADPLLMERIMEKMLFGNSQVIENETGEFKVEFAAAMAGAFARVEVLDLLEDRCAELGIRVQHDVRIDDLTPYEDADLVVGADGANSVVRRSYEAEFGTEKDTRSNYFVWWGCKHPKQEGGLRFRRYKGHSLMIHYYAYTPDMWTVVGETDEQSWLELGMDKMNNAERMALFEDAFSDVLDGNELVENKSDWVQFVATRNKTWSVGNKTLIGDALFRAHYSIGSGTRLAMEDALGLANALKHNPGNVEAALASYEERGKPRKEMLMGACQKSWEWYEQVHTKLDMPVLEFIRDFMDRTGRMPEERLAMMAPEYVKAYKEAQDAA